MTAPTPQPVNTEALRRDARILAPGFPSVEKRLNEAADEMDRLRAVNEFGMNSIVKTVADEWFDERAPSNVSMDDLNLLVHMITEKLNGGKP
ncbi:hypothetical protein [Curtobacterium luteum]|uniref:hypothetical protein n=1 Tax=Curtobacterium luteum TaxID=33881 RepID=UPI000AE81E75|nr:hypothetical protein [Curtobacterium luteum]